MTSFLLIYIVLSREAEGNGAYAECWNLATANMHMCVHSFGFMEEGGGGGFFGVFAVEGRETRIILLLGHGAEGNETHKFWESQSWGKQNQYSAWVLKGGP